VRLKVDPTHDAPPLQPWQFFVLAALGCATAVTFLVRGQGVAVVVLLSALMAATALVGLAAVRALRPLVGEVDDATPMVGRRTRGALEREKLLTLRAIKELEFDRAMGKVSHDDFHDMSNRLRTRAAGLIKALDAASGYRDRIERDLEKRLARTPDGGSGRAERPGTDAATAEARVCASCSTGNDADARFCKACGERL
jgi:hypothetical protein